MNKILYTTLLISSVLFAGCNNEDIINESHQVNNTSLKVSVEESTVQSRAGFIIPEGRFYWDSNDMLGVAINNVSNNDVKIRNFKLTSGAGTNSAKFDGILMNDEKYGKYVVYPFNNAHKLSETTLTFHLPTEYVYHKVDQDLPSSTTETENLAKFNSMNPAMVGILENNQTFLKHLGGVILVKMDEMPFSSGTVAISTLDYQHKLAGDYKINLAQIEELGRNFDGITLEDTNKDDECTVKIKYENATIGKPGNFYIPAPVGTYYGFKLSFFSNDPSQRPQEMELLDEFTIERTKIKVFIVQSISGGN